MFTITTPESSFLQRIDYNQETGILIVLFKNNKIFMYSGVPRETWDALKEAKSKGEFYGKNIKGKFPIHHEIE